MATPIQILAERNRLYNDPLTSKNGQLLADVVPAILNLIHENGGGGGGGGAASNVNVQNFPTTQAVSAISLPLPSGAASEATLASILSQLQSDRAVASQLFIDSTQVVYLRILAFNNTTNGYESATLTLNGASYTPVAPETPLVNADVDTTETAWAIVTSGVGYSTGDVVSQFSFIRHTPTPAIVAVLWYNQTTQSAISAPLAGHRRRTDGLAATETTLGLTLTQLQSLPKKATAASFGSVSTSITGANFVTLTAGVCTEVAIFNLEPSAVDLEIRRGGSGSTIVLPFGSSILIEAIADSSDIGIRRADQSDAQVTVRFERRTR